MAYSIDCRNFNGYKPCSLSTTCNSGCSHYSKVTSSVLIVHLGAIGAVLRSTSLLKAIKQKHPQSFITWITDKPSDQLLRNHPLIDQVLTSEPASISLLQHLEFEASYVIDKSLKAVSLVKNLKINRKYGFTAHSLTGAILPATPAAEELWSLGLDNHKKFFVNQKSEVQLMFEALELEYHFDLSEYFLPLSEDEQKLVFERQKNWRRIEKRPIIGINTGCSQVIPAKKLTISKHRELIAELLVKDEYNLVLLGGPEDHERNQLIGADFPVIQTPTQNGLRDGLVSVAACDIIITGDSLGMHMAISQKKYVIAWFGPTCAQEIELYGRGEKIQAQVSCAPCWKRSCDMKSMCYDSISVERLSESVSEAIKKGSEAWSEKKSSLFKLPFSEISF